MRRRVTEIEISTEDPAWRKLGKPFLAFMEEASQLALKHKDLSSPASAKRSFARGKGTQVVKSVMSSRPGSPSLMRAKGAHSPGMTILFTNDAHIRALNAEFRGKGKPTNVLAFPSDTPGYLGDIAIAYGVAAAEARLRKKRLIDHAAHLTIHGTLHLLGYDHATAREAKAMEALEIRLLAKLGIADPYARAKAAKR
jgi:probable rRNA maturation factor